MRARDSIFYAGGKMHEDSTKHRSKGSSTTARIKDLGKHTILKIAAVLAVIIVIILLVNVLSSNGSSRSESYKKASGAAGLEATISYDCKKCQKNFNFNIYIFDKNGQQVSVVRPDQRGKVNMAMQEGEYVMLIGKQFGKDKQFPQEKVSLKNGKSLELKLKYKEQ